MEQSFFSQAKPFIGLLTLGNIENLILASQGVVGGVDPLTLAILSIIFVIAWFAIGTFGTRIAIKYARHINFVGGLAIFLLGIQSMVQSVLLEFNLM